MADQCPSKSDILTIFKRLRSLPTNKVCFDCNAKNPTWASVTYGVFICIDCSAVHRSLGVHLSFVRSTQLDTNWTWVQLRHMQLGGNANASSFFRQHNCSTTDAQQKYNSRAAQLYREKLHQMATQAMRIHGTKTHLDSTSESTPATEKEVDFFEELVNENTKADDDWNEENRNLSNLTLNGSRRETSVGLVNSGGVEPNVEAALSTSPTEAQMLITSSNRKPTIGQRKPAAAKKGGLGAKKGGLGAQKVRTDFAEIEREACLADQLKERAAEEAKVVSERKNEEEDKQVASMRLAYQDLGVQQKKEEAKLRQVDPKKAEQMERLGMGFSSSRAGVSHSAFSNVQTIDQQNPTSNTPRTTTFDRQNDDFFDDFQFVSGFSMYRSPSWSDNKNLDAFGDSRDRFPSKQSWTPDRDLRPSSNFGGSGVVEDRPTRRDPPTSLSSTENSYDAQKKFGNAKSISSAQYFGDSNDAEFERRTNLSRFEGSSSISSSDYFGDAHGGSPGSNLTSPIQTPDLEDVKESVRQGVTKVAGKLSSLANGVMSSLQDRYGY